MAGDIPDTAAQAMTDEAKVRALLAELYSQQEDIELFLESPQKFFDGERPMDMIRDGRGAAVVQGLEQMLDGVYT